MDPICIRLHTTMTRVKTEERAPAGSAQVIKTV